MNLLIGVISSFNTTARRQAVFDTWAKDLDGKEQIDLIAYISAEKRHRQRDGKILYLDTTDAYAYNTWRFIEFLQYALETINPDFYFNCCDDTYVAIDRLIAFDYRNADYIGQFCRGYLGQYHPYAAGGAGFFLSKRAVEILLADKAFLESRGVMPSITDMLIGECLHRHGIELAPSERFYSQPDKQPLANNDLITCHYQSPEQMRLTHASYKHSLQLEHPPEFV